MTFRMAVVGKNIAYSKSPFIHTEFGQALGLAVEYSICDVGDNRFQDTINLLQREGFTGCNITVPYKEEAFALADQHSERAKQARAANTFVFQPDGSIFADNTDGIGFIRDVTQNIGYNLKEKRILICGAGGAVCGIIDPILAAHPAEVVIANRSLKPFRYPLVAYADLAHQAFDVVIDGTSLRDELPPLPDSLTLNRNALVYDLKYNPTGPTAIMQWGKVHGAKSVHDGIGMLVEQAAEAFSLWTGKMPETLAVIKALQGRSR